MSPLLSIVVPTKNRYRYLFHLVELIKSFNTSEIELVIQDNSDDNSVFNEYVSNIELPWLKYFYCSERLTSIENYDKAISNSTGRFVCFIGDDDGVVRTIVESCRWMERNNIEALRGLKANYYWPETGKNGGLTVIEKLNKKIEYLNPILELEKVFKKGFESIDNIPVLYTGVVRRDILDKIYNDYHTFFPGGASADIANGVALSFYVKRYAKVNIPIVITGTSAMTGGVANRRKLLSFSEIPFISSEVGKNWEGYLPQCWSGQLVWPESAIKSLRALGKEILIKDFNFTRIFALFILRNSLHLNDYLMYFDNSNKIRVDIMRLRTYSLIRKIENVVIKLLSRGKLGLGTKRINNCKTIIESEYALNSFANIDYTSLDA